MTGNENESAGETHKTFAPGCVATVTQRSRTAGRTKRKAIQRLFGDVVKAVTQRMGAAAHAARRKQKEKDEERGLLPNAVKIRSRRRLLTAARAAGRPDIARDKPQPRFNP
jgi:hypothetical protein